MMLFVCLLPPASVKMSFFLYILPKFPTFQRHFLLMLLCIMSKLPYHIRKRVLYPPRLVLTSVISQHSVIEVVNNRLFDASSSLEFL